MRSEWGCEVDQLISLDWFFASDGNHMLATLSQRNCVRIYCQERCLQDISEESNISTNWKIICEFEIQGYIFL